MACTAACPECERLRAAALGLIGEKGIEGLSQEALAERSGVSPVQAAQHYATAADCLYETYDEVSRDLLREMVETFRESSDWQTGFELSRRRLLERLAANPAQARLCFVETLRGDRELRRRRDVRRRWIVEFIAKEYARSASGDGVPPIQIELLIGAECQAISTVVADGGASELPELEPRLDELEHCFVPVPA
jgi:AcrR family transcriptional regulator